MAGRERLLDPTGDSDRTADTTLSPRLRSVRGLTAGLLENAKPNAAALLSNVARELQRRHGLRAAVMYTKSNPDKTKVLHSHSPPAQAG